MSPTLLELQIMEIANLGIMEIDNFKKKIWKSTTSGKNWGNRQQQRKNYGIRIRPYRTSKCM